MELLVEPCRSGTVTTGIKPLRKEAPQIYLGGFLLEKERPPRERITRGTFSVTHSQAGDSTWDSQSSKEVKPTLDRAKTMCIT